MTPTLMAILIIVTHFSVDWILQTRYEATNKSKNPMILLRHLALNQIAFSWVIFGNQAIPLGFVWLNTITHGLIDWNIWRLYAWCHRNEPPEFMERNLYAKDYWFYFTIAVDQMLHLTIALALFMPRH
jgi:hypothetical protein